LYLFAGGIRGFAAKDFIRGCVKRFLPPTAAEYSSERHVILTISLREIVRMTCLSKHNLARSAVKILFTQPQHKILTPEAAKDFWHKPKKIPFFKKILAP
jgi:hypothetical protein